MDEEIQNAIDLSANARKSQHAGIEQNGYGRFCHENHLKPDAIATVNAFEVLLDNMKFHPQPGPDDRPQRSLHSQSWLKSLHCLLRGADKSCCRKTFACLLLPFLGLVFTPGCSRSSANQYDSGEANVMIAAAYAAKDGECGTSHTFTSILFFPADRANVEACAAAILDTSCTDWSVTDPTPDVCKFIGVQFES